jgi:hypothetical protein
MNSDFCDLDERTDIVILWRRSWVGLYKDIRLHGSWSEKLAKRQELPFATNIP